MPSLASDSVRTERLTIPDVRALGVEWMDVERRSVGSFFTSWAWIGLWVERMARGLDCTLLRATLENRTVGLAVVCTHRVMRSRFVPSRCLFMHATGRPHLDDLTIEFNGVLAESGLEEHVSRAFVQCLLNDNDWDELCVDGCDAKMWAKALADSTAIPVVRRSSPDYFVELAGLGDGAKLHVDSLKPRVRQYVRRTLREAERLGPLRLRLATDADEALSFLTELQRLHQKSWTAKGSPGAFANPQFVGFHQELVRREAAGGAVNLLCLTVGDSPVAYLYNFVHRGRVFYYQSGLDRTFAPGVHWRPGIIAHMLAIEHYAKAGYDTYDFMAGDHSYKKDLSNSASELSWVSVRRPRMRFHLEDLARKLTGRR